MSLVRFAASSCCCGGFGLGSTREQGLEALRRLYVDVEVRGQYNDAEPTPEDDFLVYVARTGGLARE